MKAWRLLTASAVAVAAWSPPSFAQRQQVVADSALDANGSLNGVDLTGNVTLSVGAVGGPTTDIFTANNPLGTVPGLAVSTAASSQGSIVFNSGSTVFGNIGVTQPGGPFLLNLSGGNAGTAVNFQGQVFATTLNVTGTGAVNFNSGSLNITATNFAADGTIGLAPNTTVIGALTTTAGANTGTLALGGGSVLDGAVGGAVGLRAINVVGGSNLAGVSSTISGAVSAFSFNLGTNTLNIGGALTIANMGAAGVINTTLASPTVFGSIRPVGATNLGPTLAINVTVPDTTFLPVGTRFNIVQTQTGTLQSGTDGTVLLVSVANPTNPLYTFVPVPLAGTLDGLVTIELTGIPLMVPIAPPPGVVLPPAAPVAMVGAQTLLATPPTPDLINVLAAFNALSDPAAVVLALAQTAPSASDLVAPMTTFQGTREFQNLWLSRLDDVFCAQVSEREQRSGGVAAPCRDDGPNSGWWLNGFGRFADQDARSFITGYDSRTVGTMIGYDVPVGRDARAGLGVGYARTKIDGDTFDADTEFDTYRATAYIGYEPLPWFAYGELSFGYHDYSGRRRIAFAGFDRTARSEYDGRDYTTFGTTGYHFFAQGYTITPFASLQYSHVTRDGYRETGAGDINLVAQSDDYDFVESGLGLEIARPFRYREQTFVPEVHTRWLHQFSDQDFARTAQFTAPGSPSFSTPELKMADDTWIVGAGVKLLSCACSAATWSVDAVYDYEMRTDDYDSHTAMLRVSSRF